MFLPDGRLKTTYVILSLSTDEEQEDSDDEPDKEKGDTAEDEAEEEEMNRKLAELKAEEVAELKRYNTFLFEPPATVCSPATYQTKRESFC